MERVKFNYSMKNIPIPSKNAYLKNLIFKLESFIKQIRWKAYLFENSNEINKTTTATNFGFKSVKTPPKNEHLSAFENDLYDLVRNIEFKRINTAFQNQLNKDINSINNDPLLFIPADKTNNLYKLNNDKYKKLLQDNITKSYKKANTNSIRSINKEAKTIAEDLKLDDRIEQFSEREAFITLKDHKENFQNNTKCRLINPAKSEIGIISKHYIETINNTIREKTQVNQWRNTKLVIEWFKAIKNKSKCSFIKFDIVDFYPSISEELLSKAIAYAQSVTTIEEKVIRTIYHSRKSLLFDRDNVWVKKDNPEFDVTMGSYDGAELCELVGLYLLDLLAKEFDKKYFGLYRDDGLGCFENISGPDSERIKKKIIKIFKSNGLNITVECNLIVTDFLDVTFDLKSGTYYPYRKPNNELLYINKHSNHPPSIIRQIPSMISKRISENSCDKNHFDKAAPDYNIALKNSGYNEAIKYIPIQPKRQSRKRQIIWFNPPYSANVKTNVGRNFMRLVDKHFPRHHKYHKLFNKNNIKLSYSCMPNMNNIIRKHNSNVMKDPIPPTTYYPVLRTYAKPHQLNQTH